MEDQINYLVDTNVWLELLLNQEQAEIVKEFFNTVPSKNLSISDFSLHSIGVILNRLKKIDIFVDYINDLFSIGYVSCLNLETLDNLEISKLITEKKLDYDDSYQAVVSQKYDIQIVTFDVDFKKCGIKTLSPKEAIEKYKKITTVSNKRHIP